MTTALCLGLVGAVLFALLASTNLTAQGLFRDELQGAQEAFAYLGKPIPGSSNRLILGIPVLNMPFSGAIKSAVYGLYMRFTEQPFGILSWRSLGIAFVALGLLSFFPIARRALTMPGSLAFLALFLTDTTLLLTTRHDYGPTALALLLRLLFIAVILRGSANRFRAHSTFFFLGLLAGTAIYEKLTALLLLFPLSLVLLIHRGWRRWGLCLLGGVVGTLPLAIVHLRALLAGSGILTLSEPHRTFFLHQILDFFSLGNGALVESLMLGQVSATSPRLEPILLLGMAALTFALVLLRVADARRDPENSRPVPTEGPGDAGLAQTSGLLLVSYCSIGIALMLLPRQTWAHHWIIGTPFQYSAVALILTTTHRVGPLDSLSGRALRAALLLAVLALVCARLPIVWQVEQAMIDGRASVRWNPSLNQLGLAAAKRRGEAVFIATNWGLAPQLLCLANGEPGFVFPAFWDYRGREDIEKIVDLRPGRDLYFVERILPVQGGPYPPNIMVAVQEDMRGLDGWRETPVEPDLARLEAVRVKKYVRARTSR